LIVSEAKKSLDNVIGIVIVSPTFTEISEIVDVIVGVGFSENNTSVV